MNTMRNHSVSLMVSENFRERLMLGGLEVVLTRAARDALQGKMPSTQQLADFVGRLTPEKALDLLRASSHMEGLRVEALTVSEVAAWLATLQAQLALHAETKPRQESGITVKWLALILVGLAAAAWVDGRCRPSHRR